MREKLLNLTLPREYKENLFEYIPNLDGEPDWIECQRLGYTIEQYQKLITLVSIERMKYILDEAINDNEITEEEIEFSQQLIDARIKEYNEL